MNPTVTDALSGVNIQNFVDNPNPNKNMRVYFSITPREGWDRTNGALVVDLDCMASTISVDLSILKTMKNVIQQTMMM